MNWELSRDSESSTLNSQLVRYSTVTHRGPTGELVGSIVFNSVILSFSSVG